MRQKIELKEMQQLELSILKAFASFCDRHSLRYFLAGGTLLGAVRHQGFIPWDDDIDVHMPRRDYMTFLDLAGGTLEPYYKIFSPYNCRDYILTYTKLCDARTVLIEVPGISRIETPGVFIDIFPLDGLPNSDSESDRFFSKLRRYRTRQWFCARVEYICLKRERNWKNIVSKKVAGISRKLAGRYQRKIDDIARSYDFDNCSYVAVVVAGDIAQEITEKTCLSGHQKTAFEHCWFNIPVGYERCLTNRYGDYMKLPPEKDRVKYHNHEAFWKEANGH